MKFSLAIPLLVLLVSCGVSVPPPPSNLSNACSIKNQRPSWMKSMTRVQRKWGVPVATQMAIIYQESKFVGDARTPLDFRLGIIPMGRDSSAYGYAQAIDATWDWYRRDTGNSGARRDRFDDAVDFMGWYMDQSYQRLGISKSDTRHQYLAYHDGHTGYQRKTYRRKSWLLRVSKEVANRADMYSEQLKSCSRR